MMSEIENRYLHYAMLAITCLFAFFVNTKVIPANLMESRNLASAQEMVREGNYMTPTMNAEARLENPPLPTWIAAGLEHLSEDNLKAQRYMSGAIATLMVVFLYLLVVEMTRSRGLAILSALILATSFNVVLTGRTAAWDIYCHSFMLGAIYFLVRAFQREGKRWGDFILAGLFLGLSFLSKGPVALYAMLLPFVIGWIRIMKPKIEGKWSPFTVMLVVAVAVSFWWYGYNLIFNNEAMLSAMQRESSNWLSHNVRSFWYYWKFPAEAGIWTTFFVTAIIAFFTFNRGRYAKEYKFAMIWLLASLLLLSIVPEKKTRYLLPTLIPGAIIIGTYFYNSIIYLRTRAERVLFRVNATIIATIIAAIPILLYILLYKEGKMSTIIVVATAVISWGNVIYILRSTYGRILIPRNIFYSIVGVVVMVEAICLIPIGKLLINDDRESIRGLREDVRVSELPFYHSADELIRAELIYETNRTIRPIDINNHREIEQQLPLVYVSKVPLDSAIVNNYDVELIGEYDNNWRKTESRRYNWDLVRQVAIVRAKKSGDE